MTDIEEATALGQRKVEEQQFWGSGDDNKIAGADRALAEDPTAAAEPTGRSFCEVTALGCVPQLVEPTSPWASRRRRSDHSPAPVTSRSSPAHRTNDPRTSVTTLLRREIPRWRGRDDCDG